MTGPNAKFQRHFFVCVKDRPAMAKPSCGARHSAEVYNALVEELGGHEELWETVCVTVASCLGPCFDGPMVVVYPEGTWYAGVTKDDVPELVEKHMVAGQPVERLLYKWPTVD
jgi:(2Fe-2S) ferredoxin